MADQDEKPVKLSDLNGCIVCKLCKGYLIGATTVTECLHTFCKSCLVKHFEDDNRCPECRLVIHQSHPLHYIKFDRTMQDIVYKLVPGLMEQELERERSFYKARGTDCPRDLPGYREDPEPSSSSSTNTDQSDNHRLDEQVNIKLEAGVGMKQMQRQFIRVSGNATVTHVKKYVSSQLLDGKDYDKLEILCNDEPQGKDHTLKFVYVTKWRFKEPPMVLKYQKMQ